MILGPHKVIRGIKFSNRDSNDPSSCTLVIILLGVELGSNPAAMILSK